MSYSDYLPAGTTRTSFRARARHVPYLPDYFNHQWFEDYIDDFLTKNIAENNGVISGCVISQDGGNDAINMTAGVIFVNGNSVAVSAPSTYECLNDGWYVIYITSAGSVLQGYVQNSTVQGAVTPNDAVIVGYALRGEGSFFIKSFFNDASRIAEAIEKSQTQGADHLIGTNAQVLSGDADIYYDSSTSLFRDIDDLEVTITDGQKLIWKGLDALTANIDLSSVDFLEFVIDPGTTINLGAFDLLLGERIRGELDLTGTGDVTIISSDGLRVKSAGGLTVTKQSGDITINNYIPGKAVDFDVKNMLINVSGADSLTLTADVIQYVNSIGETREEYNVNDAWVPSTDIIGGEAGTTSQWLQAWRNYLGDMRLTVCEEGSATGTSAGFLVAASNTLFSRGAVQGDYLFNMATFQKTKISTTPIADNANIEVDDDIFVSGNGYKLIKNTAPAVLGEFAACLGFGEQDSGLDLVDSGYTRPELQKIVEYSESNGDFTLTGASSWVTTYAKIVYQQRMEFGNSPLHILTGWGRGAPGVSATSILLTYTGVIFKPGIAQMGMTSNDSLSALQRVICSGGDGNITLDSSASNTNGRTFHFQFIAGKKPSFATRS